MGMIMSSMGKGLPTNQLMNSLTNSLYQKFVDSNIKNGEDFQNSILKVFNAINASLPGMHYNAPSSKAILDFYKEWNEASSSNEEKKAKFTDFIVENVKLSSLDSFTMVTGLVTPPAAMALKRAGESVPQIKFIKVIPDVIFVPSATLLALVSAKFTRRFSNVE